MCAAAVANKTLTTLIKLYRRRLDELRRAMVALENEKSQLQLASARLQQELEDEIRKATEQPEMGHFFGGFATRIQQRQEELASAIHEIDMKIRKLNDDISEAFTDVKKYEIAQDNQKKREAQEALRKETIMLDELASQQHRRQREESSE